MKRFCFAFFALLCLFSSSESKGQDATYHSVTAGQINGFYYVDNANYTSVQAAITAACNAGGGNVIIGPGSWAAPNLAGLTICSNLNVGGGGRGPADSSACVTTITTNQTSGDFLAGTAMIHSRFHDFCIKNTAAAGANAAIRLNWGQFDIFERIYISGPFAVAIELDTSSTGASTIRNTFEDIFDTGLAANGTGCLLNSSNGAANGHTINNNRFHLVACQGGASGANAIGIKLTNTDLGQAINENVFNCDELATATGMSGGTGLLLTQNATADLILIGCNIENNHLGFSKALGNTVIFVGGGIQANDTQISDAQPAFTSLLNTRVQGTVQTWAVTALGGQYVDGLGIGGATPGTNMINGAAGWTGRVGSTVVFTVNTASFGLAFPLFLTERSAPTCAVNIDFLFADSVAHRIKECDNNGSPVQLVHSGVDINPSDQVTATHLAAPLPKAQTLGTTVYTDQANTFGAFAQDFSGVTLLKLRVAAGLTTSTNGDCGYDTTNKNWHCWTNGADLLAGIWSATPTNNDCVKASVSGGVVSLVDAGAPCDTAAGSVTNVSVVNDTNVTSSVANPTTTPAITLGWAGQLAVARGGSGQSSAASARGSSGFNIDELTTHGDSAYTILSTDRVVATSATLTAARTWTLPAANTLNAGQVLWIIDLAGGVTASNTLTVSRAGSDTINGGTSVVLVSANDGVALISDGSSKWTFAVKGLEQGGTGAGTASAARTALGLAAIASSGSASDLGTGTIPNARIVAVPNSSLANMAANTYKGNPTGSSAAPTDSTLPSCPDNSSNHLNYVSGTGFTCGTGGSFVPLNVQSNLSPVTMNGTDLQIFTYAIPAGIIPVGGSITVEFTASHSTGILPVTWKFKIGSASGTTISNYGSPSGVGTHQGAITLYNQGSGLTTKVDKPFVNPNPAIQAGPGYGADNTGDFSAGFSITLTANGAGTEAITPQFWIVK